MEFEEEVLQAMIRLENRETSDAQLMLVFDLTADQLTAVRQTPAYKLHRQSMGLNEALNDADTDDGWDNMERRAIGALNAELEANAVSDPRTLLSIAKHANSATRRAQTRAASGRERKGIAENALQAGDTVVIAMRTTFFEKSNKDGGRQRLLDRQVTIIDDNQGDVEDAVTIQDMRNHIEDKLGLNMDDLKTGGGFRVDSALANILEADDSSNQTTFMAKPKGNENG